MLSPPEFSDGILDAFDFFVLVFLVDVLASNFHVSKAEIVWTITITLATRPIGAFVLGSLADRYGRRRPLIAGVLYFSIITAFTPFAPSYVVFAVLRALYGIGMGGYWGIGASLVMESSPSRWRGLFSGIMQAGYSGGYLLAAVALRTIEPRFGWRWMFLCGLGIARDRRAYDAFSRVLVLGKASAHQFYSSGRRSLAAQKGLRLLDADDDRDDLPVARYQDLYPDFLKTVHRFSNGVVSNLAILYNIGAIVGAMVVGHYSDRLGRRYSIILALVICALSIPLWAFGSTVVMLAVGSFVMQFGVQGAFGVIPAHLNELSPSSVRSLFPGVVYQLGVLLCAPAVVIEFTLRRHFGYQWALTIFEICVIFALLLIFGFGPERKGHNFSVQDKGLPL